jgi:TRAP-type C4-dicarboxylate transport system substrate-binding protein
MHKIKLINKAVLVTAIMGGLAAAQAKPVVLRVHHFLGLQTVQQTMINDWCNAIDAKSAGELTCKIYPAMQLGGSPPQLYDQARDGVADVVWTVAGYSGNRFAKSQAFELPFTMTGAEATSRAAWDYMTQDAADEIREVKMLAVHVSGPGIFFTNKRPIRTANDLKDMRMRGPTVPVTTMLKAFGATPVAMPVPKIPEALSKGVVDGAVIPYQIAPALRVHELAKFTSVPDRQDKGLYTTVFFFAMNQAKYNSLPAKLQAVINETSGQALSATMGRMVEEDDQRAEAIFQKTPGMQISTIPMSELKKWRTVSNQLTTEWITRMNNSGVDGAKLVKRANDLIAKYTQAKM